MFLLFCFLFDFQLKFFGNHIRDRELCYPHCYQFLTINYCFFNCLLNHFHLSFTFTDNFFLKLALFFFFFCLLQLLYKKIPSVFKIDNSLIILFDHLLNRFWIGTGALKTRLATTLCSKFLAAICSDLLVF